jgi:hypothetical protein
MDFGLNMPNSFSTKAYISFMDWKRKGGIHLSVLKIWISKDQEERNSKL